MARMTIEETAAETCTTMAQVRTAIDRIDRQIVTLLGARFRYVEAAARIKADPAAVRDEPRIAQVIDNARETAAEEGVPPELAAQLYRILIEASVAYELDKFRDKAESGS